MKQGYVGNTGQMAQIKSAGQLTSRTGTCHCLIVSLLEMGPTGLLFKVASRKMPSAESVIVTIFKAHE